MESKMENAIHAVTGPAGSSAQFFLVLKLSFCPQVLRVPEGPTELSCWATF